MRPRRAVARLLFVPILAAAVVCAWPARAQDDALFLRGFYAECLSALGELAPTREHRVFLLKRRIDLEVTDEDEKIPSDAIGLYSDVDNKMYFRKETIDSGRKTLSGRGVADDEIARMMAWKMLPTMAHEIRHAITHDKIRRRLGFTFAMPCLESEMISFVDTVRVMKAAIAAKPDYWADGMLVDVDADNGQLLAAWRKNPSALKDLVEPLYPDIASVLDMSQEELLARVDDRLQESSRSRDKVLAAQKAALAMRDPEERALALKALDASGDERSSRVDLERIAALRLAIGDTVKYKGLREFYLKQIKALVRLTP